MVKKTHFVCKLNPFKCINTCLWLRICFILVNILCALEKDMLYGMGCFINVNKLDIAVYCCSRFLYHWFSVCSINYWDNGISVSDYNSGFVYFSLEFYPFLFYVLWSSVIRCINVYKVVISSGWIDSFIIINWPL